MLIRFSLENWMSFKNRVSFSMIASRELQHKERVPELPKYKMRVLPIAAIYGGNASGKTNFFRALNFVKGLVIRGTQPDSPIPVETFRLNPDAAKQPSRFEFELLIDETIYEFNFSITRDEVLDEKIVVISSNNEKELYHRTGDKITLSKSLSKDDQFLKFIFKGTRKNQLFLTNSIWQNAEHFRPVYNWFKETLWLISPISQPNQLEEFLSEENPLSSNMDRMLQRLDTGISQLRSEKVPIETLQLSKSEAIQVQELIKKGKNVNLLNNRTKERFVINRKEDKPIARKLVAFHHGTDGCDIKFEIHEESDGTQRVIDLLPAFLELSSQASKKVYVIDELDRSLHTLLTRNLLKTYLSHCNPEKRSQLLLTTHDVLLMDQKLLRRDEMWVTERDSNESSNLFSFSDYKDIRYDKDIRKSYLQGRFGGIPQILLGNDHPSTLLQENQGE
ncbi:MAG: ATP-binding protein [Verrucomicrobia bacterium]|nr:ATP-binding protein [Verrucomicrobiota bacterium]